MRNLDRFYIILFIVKSEPRMLKSKILRISTRTNDAGAETLQHVVDDLSLLPEACRLKLMFYSLYSLWLVPLPCGLQRVTYGFSLAIELEACSL